MKERPILFSGDMVRAILDGRKTQTRRVITKWSGPKLSPGNGADQDGYCTVENHTIARKPWTADLIGRLIACPYGQPGDRLWVREAWRLTGAFANEKPSNYDFPDILRDNVAYRADPYSEGVDDAWRPSIHLPRGLSRILLEITNVRVERVQEINEDDVHAEGCDILTTGREHAQEWFRNLWDSINAARGYGWDVNPWVWVIEFRRVK